MNPNLRNIVAAVALLSIGGVTYTLYTRDPSTRTALELRDGGLLEGQRMVMECPERLDSRAINRFRRHGYNVRPKQQYGMVWRVVFVFDGGIVSASGSPGGFIPDSGDEDDDIDESAATVPDRCRLLDCPQPQPLLPDGGVFYQHLGAGDPNFCRGIGRTALVTPGCVLPACYTQDGGIDDSNGGLGYDFNAASRAQCWDNLRVGPDGGPDFGGCWNVFGAARGVGPGCRPVVCEMRSGDDPYEGL